VYFARNLLDYCWGEGAVNFLIVVMLFLREYTFLAATAEFLLGSLPSEREPFRLSFYYSLLRSMYCSFSREGDFLLVLFPLAVKYQAAL
jgi:hypothetical protein